MTITLEDLKPFLREGEVVDELNDWLVLYDELKDKLFDGSITAEERGRFAIVLSYDSKYGGAINPELIEKKNLIINKESVTVVSCAGNVFSKARIHEGLKAATYGEFVTLSDLKARYLVANGIYPVTLAKKIIKGFLGVLKESGESLSYVDAEKYPEFKRLMDTTEIQWDRVRAVNNSMYKNTYNLSFNIAGEDFIMSTGRILEQLTTYNLNKDKLIVPKSDKRRKVFQALRYLIKEQIHSWRQANGGGEGMHVDHITPFKNISGSWMAARGLTIDYLFDCIEWSTVDGFNYATGFKEHINVDWQQWHLSMAEYRFLSPTDNLTRTKLVNTLSLKVK